MSKQPARHSALENAGGALWQSLLADVRAGSFQGPATGGATTINLREELAKPHSETLAETIQHLSDLGYLSKSSVERAGSAAFTGLGQALQIDSMLARALSIFQADEAEFSRWFTIRAVRGWSVPPPETSAGSSPDPLLITAESVIRLRALTSLDGVIEFREVPAVGSTNLASRVAHHLLRIYGILPEGFSTDTPWGMVSTGALRCCSRLLKLSTAVETPWEILNHLANFDATEHHIANQEESWNLLIPAPAQRDWLLSLATQRRSLNRFREAAARAIKGDNIFFDQSDRTTFGIRLLQISLWQSGHYFGELDGLWGLESDAALRRAALVRAPSENTNENPLDGIVEENGGTIHIKLPDSLRHLGEWQPRVFRAAANDDSANSGDDLGRLQISIREQLEVIGGWHKATSGEIAEKEAMAWNRLYEEVDTGPVADGLGAARANYGMRSVASGVDWLIGKLKDIVSDVKQKFVLFYQRVTRFVDELVEAISGAALQAFRFLKRGLAGAIRVAALAGRRLLRMIRGEPFATITSPGSWILTRFSFDQDTLSFCSNAIERKDVSGHFQEITWENRGLETTLIVGAKVLTILVACSPPVAGLVAIRLALDIFRTLSRTPSLPPSSSSKAMTPRAAARSPGLAPVEHLPTPVYLTA